MPGIFGGCYQFSVPVSFSTTKCPYAVVSYEIVQVVLQLSFDPSDTGAEAASASHLP